MLGDLWRCGQCDALVPSLSRWKRYRFNTHTFDFRQEDILCGRCADEVLERSKTALEPDEWLVHAIAGLLNLHSGEPMTVQVTNWDEHAAIVLCRAEAFEFLTFAE